jgi:hypothetical protein
MECWASILGGCGGGSSREHYISDGILDGRTVNAFGLEWCKDAPKTIGIASATAKILCKIHNEALSPFDAEASKLSQFLTANVWDDPLKTDTITLSGPFIEKWALKTPGIATRSAATAFNAETGWRALQFQSARSERGRLVWRALRRISRSRHMATIYLSEAGFVELDHYYRPAGVPPAQQPWLASVWRRGDGTDNDPRRLEAAMSEGASGDRDAREGNRVRRDSRRADPSEGVG